MSNHDDRLKLLAGFLVALAFGAYLAFCDWRDARKARRSGYDCEGCE